MKFNKPVSALFGNLRTVLTIPLIIQITVVVGLVGWLSFRQGQQAVYDLVHQLQQEVATHIKDYLTTYTQKPLLINQINRNALQLGLLKQLEQPHLIHHFWQQLQQFQSVDYIGFSTTDADYIGLRRRSDHTITLEIADKTHQLKMWEMDSAGQRGRLKKYTPRFNPHDQPWYRTVAQTGQPNWHAHYPKDQPTTFWASHPLYDAQGRLFAVTTTALALSALNRFLGQLRIGQNGQSLIINRSGTLLASSASDLPAHAHQNSLIQATLRYLTQRYSISALQTAQTARFNFAETTYLLRVLPAQPRPGLEWWVVILLPETDFMAHIQANLITTLLICFIVLGITTLVSWLISGWIVQPLLQLNQAAKAFANGDWQQNLVHTRQDEIGQLNDTFRQMAAQLQTLFVTLQEKNKELRRLDKLKDEFLANTSHELRTPLNGIIGITESLIDGDSGQLSEATCAELTLVVTSARRLYYLVDDILDFSKLKQKGIQLTVTSVDIREMVDLVLKLCRPLVGQKALELVNAVPPHLPAVAADDNRLQQILYNLIGNAIKFTETGTLKISATLIKEDSSDTDPLTALSSLVMPYKRVTITVADTGIGIAPHALPHLFTPFEQGHVTSSSGLGLTVTQKLIELHGGTLHVDSKVGLGSRFSFRLPVSSEPALPLQARMSWSVALTDAPPPPVFSEEEKASNKLLPYVSREGEAALQQQTFNILIVDDEPVNLYVLVNYLTRHHYNVTQATSGLEALDLLQGGLKLDLVLLDVMMPHMTGYEVTQKIRVTWQADELPILLLTAKNQVADLVTGLEVGANDYLIKPVSKHELLARIKTHIHIKQLKAETLKLAIEGEKRLTQFLEAVPVGIFVIDVKGKPYWINRKAQQLLGKGVLSEVTRDNLTAIYQVYKAGTTELYPPEQLPGARALAGENITMDDLEIHQTDKIIPIEAWGTPIFDEQGRITYAIVAFQDITERRQAEQERKQFTDELYQLNQQLAHHSQHLEQEVAERTRKLRESEARLADAQQMALLGHWVWDMQTEHMVHSEQNCRNLDLTPGISTTYEAFIERIHPEDRILVRATLAKCLDASQTKKCSGLGFEFRVITPQNQIRTLLARGEVELDQTDKPMCMKGFTQDITERKQIELKLETAKRAAEAALQQLQATQQQLIESAKMADLGKLVAGVAHEINTPIGIGVTATSRLTSLTQELMQSYQSNTLRRQDLEKYLQSVGQGSELVLKNLTRAAELIQSFKQVAVDQTGEQRRCFALKEYLHEILTSLQPKFKRTQHQTKVICDDTIILSSYPGAFSQIITNLVMNSLIHGFRDRPIGCITIQAEKKQQAAEKTLLITYSDDGQGIPPTAIQHIFEPFFTTNRQGGGSGLGLHIVYNLVTHKLNGTLQCESTLGEGVVFKLHIPYPAETHMDSF